MKNELMEIEDKLEGNPLFNQYKRLLNEKEHSMLRYLERLDAKYPMLAEAKKCSDKNECIKILEEFIKSDVSTNALNEAYRLLAERVEDKELSDYYLGLIPSRKPVTIDLDIELKKKLINLVIKKGYITESKLHEVAKDKYELAMDYLFSYKFDVFEDLPITGKNPLEKLLYLYELDRNSSGLTRSLSSFNIISDLNIDFETIEFYALGYDAITNTFSHTPGEAAVFLDIPRDEALKQHAMLKLFLSSSHCLEKLDDLIYYFTDITNSYRLEDYDGSIYVRHLFKRD